MVAKQSAESEFAPTTRQVSMVERFHCVLYPFDILTLLDQLPSHGWIVSEALDEAEDTKRVHVPVKGNNRLRIDQGNKTLGVGGRDVTEVLAGYREVRTLAREISPLSPEVSTHFVELRYIGRVGSSENPSAAFSRFWAANEQVSQLAHTLGDRLPSAGGLLPYGIRFATVAPDANRTNWSELSLQPAAMSGGIGYQFDLIYRHQDSAVVEKVSEHAEETIREAIAQIEGTGNGRRSHG